MAHATFTDTHASGTSFNLASALKTLAAMRETSKQRRALSRLTDTQLNDLGMTPAQRTAECDLRFWQSAG